MAADRLPGIKSGLRKTPDFGRCIKAVNSEQQRVPRYGPPVWGVVSESRRAFRSNHLRQIRFPLEGFYALLIDRDLARVYFISAKRLVALIALEPSASGKLDRSRNATGHGAEPGGRRIKAGADSKWKGRE